MSYASFSGLGAFGALSPVQMVAKAGADRALKEAYGGKVPAEATLASAVFVGAMSGDLAATTAAMQETITKAGAIGAAAACAATGAGAIAAPVCGAIGAFIAGGVGRAIFGGPSAPTCNDELEATLAAHIASLKPFFDTHGPDYPQAAVAEGDTRNGRAWLIRKTTTAVRRYYNGMFASRAYIAPGKDVPCDSYYKGRALVMEPPAQRTYAEDVAASKGQLVTFLKDRLASQLAGFALESKINKWAKASTVARALAEAEYKQLASVCNARPPGSPPPIRVPGKRTACEEKAWTAAVNIASASYLFHVVDGAPAILDWLSEATRRAFMAEVEQDRRLSGLENSAAAEKAFREATERLKTSQAILASLPAAQLLTGGAGPSAGALAGIGLLAAAAIGGLYVMSRARR